MTLGLRDAGLKSGLNTAKRSIGESLAGLGGAFGLQLGIAGAAIGAGLVVKLGSDADEIQSKFEAVFKELSAETEEFAKTFGKNVGRSVVDTKRALSEFQDVLVPLGFDRKEAAELSKTLLSLGTDLASFNNKSDEDAAQAVRKALLGEREMMKELGVAILESDVKLKLLEKGQNKLTGSALKQAKALATLELIQELSSDAIGDAIRTSGGFANRLKALQGATKDAASAFGQIFTPVLADSLGVMTELVLKIGSLIGAMGDLQDVNIRNQKQGFLVEWRNDIAIFLVTWKSLMEILKADMNLLLQTAKATFANLGNILRIPFSSPSEKAKIITQLLIDPKVQEAAKASEDARLAWARETLALQQNMREQAAFVRSGGQGGGRAKRDPIDIKPKQLSGFFGFSDLSKKIQEQTLKQQKPQEKMAGLMEADKVVQAQQLQAMKTLVAGQQNQPGNVIAVATP